MRSLGTAQRVFPGVEQGVRYSLVDELKGIAILLVIAYHILGVLGIVAPIHLESGVDIFLMISGFILAAFSYSMPARTFIGRRLLRIYPTYWMALIFFMILRAPFSNAVSPMSALLHAAGLHSFAGNPYFSDINAAFWFISLMLLCYVLFIAVRRYLQNPYLTFFVGAGLSLVAYLAYSQAGMSDAGTMFAPRLMSFFVGMVVGYAATHGNIWKKPNIFLPLFILLVAASYAIGMSYVNAITGIIIVGLWLLLRKTTRVLGTAGRSFAYVGLISYELFLFHTPFVQEYNLFVLRRVIGVVNPGASHVLASTLVGLLVAVGVSLAVRRLSRAISESLLAKQQA